MRRPEIVRRSAVWLTASLLATLLARAGPAGADDLGVDVPPPTASVSSLEEPPCYGIYYDRTEPEKIQFYRLVDIDFARRLRQVADTHPFAEAAADAD